MEPSRIIHPASEAAQAPPSEAAQAPREWLVANGLGGYACGPLSGPPIRRYHGWLIAALGPPWGRTILVNRMIETIHLDDGRAYTLATGQDSDAQLLDFRLDWGLPSWRFACGDTIVERAAVMEYGRNRTFVRWRVLSGQCRSLTIRPWVQARPHGLAVDASPARGQAHCRAATLIAEIPDFPAVHFSWGRENDAAAIVDAQTTTLFYANEAEGGDPATGPLWSPGQLMSPFHGNQPLYLRLDIAGEAGPLPQSYPLGADPWAVEIKRRRALLDRANPVLRHGLAAELVLAADSFIVQPRHRLADDQARTIIAGYHWFADWGRDTMIALEGLSLVTGRAVEAKTIIAGFAAHVQDGLIPNMFPDGHEAGLYNTADATLWFFHAVDRVVALTGDMDFLATLLPVLDDIIAHHVAGTRFGIAMDPTDGLLHQGEPGQQLTWMDAKVGDWVVTPRRGKAVEINALWHNAVSCLAAWRHRLGRDDDGLQALAQRIATSFNTRFWSEQRGYLFDVVDGENGDDNSLRPNQLFAISLPHPVLARQYWRPVVDQIRHHLLTPVGLRSLGPADPAYCPRFFGDRLARDGAYHQGTVWAWLIGPFVQAWLKAYPDDKAQARADLAAFAPHLSQFGLGSIGEVFDGDAPHHPRGCISQAWSVAEWLRATTLLECP